MLLHKIIALICCILLILCILPLWKNKFAGNKVLLKITSFHQIYAFLLLVLALVHGILAGNNPAMFSGKIAWMILLLKNKPRWKKIHMALSIIFVGLVILHIIHAIIV